MEKTAELLRIAVAALASVILTLAGVVVYLFKKLQKRNDLMIQLALRSPKDGQNEENDGPDCPYLKDLDKKKKRSRLG